jgi:hypothetical protein
MTLFLQNDAGGSGTGGVFADRGFGHLIQIANMDAGIGQNAPVGDLIQITYSKTLTGTTLDRLDDLVNTDFTDVAGSTDIIVIPVDETFVRPNGTFVTENAGLTFPVGNSENPTSSVLIVYDTSDNGGNGYCLPREGGGTTSFPGSVILYHELSHALRMATSSQLDNSDTGCDANDEEHQAEIDENDMRDVLGVDHRDTTSHCTTSGCTSNCCIVASVATGSGYSGDVNRLRSVRDRSLRWAEVGFDFFEHLHHDYYAFSPQVVQMMEGAKELRDEIAAVFVVPLTRGLELLRYYASADPTPAQVGAHVIDTVASTPELVGMTAEHVAVALATLRAPTGELLELPQPLGRVVEVLHANVVHSDFLRWGIVDSIEIYLEAVQCLRAGDEADTIGRHVIERYDHWTPQLPVTDVWQRLSTYAVAEELTFLAEFLMPRQSSRRRFAERLARHLDGQTTTLDLDAALRDSHFLDQGVNRCRMN